MNRPIVPVWLGLNAGWVRSTAVRMIRWEFNNEVNAYRVLMDAGDIDADGIPEYLILFQTLNADLARTVCNRLARDIGVAERNGGEPMLDLVEQIESYAEVIADREARCRDAITCQPPAGMRPERGA